MLISDLGLLSFWCPCSGKDVLGENGNQPILIRDAKQSRTDGSGSQPSIVAHVWICGYTKIDFVNQKTLERFSHTWSNKTDNISELSHQLKYYPRNMLPHIRLWSISKQLAPIHGSWARSNPVFPFIHTLLSTTDTGEKDKNWNTYPTHFPPNLDSLTLIWLSEAPIGMHPSQLCEQC